MVTVTPLRIPVIRFETHTWTPQPTGAESKAELRRQTGSYASALTPPIAGWMPDISAEDAADLDEASRALASFDNYSAVTLGRQSPALGPMAAILLRTESASSSQIEQLTTSARQLALEEIDENGKANARAVVGNVHAMQAALALADHVSTDSILSMHRELLKDDPELSGEAGAFRQQLVWIGPGDAGPLTADFVPPQHSLIADAMDDLIAFSQRVDLPPLLQTAIAHAQFETIHPFPDGNGRTGRAFAQSLLRHYGLVSHTTVPISAGLLRDTAGYFSALTAFRAGDAGPIVRRFSDAARYAAASGRGLVDALKDQLDSSREALAGIRSQSAVWTILPALLGQPIVNAKYLSSHLGLGAMTAHRALQTLAERGVLKERTGRSRNRVWEHPGILGVLDEYAAEVRRSSRP